MSVTTVRLKQETEAELQSVADTLQRSKSWVINKALEEFFARQRQEQERWSQTLAAIDAAAMGRVVPGEAVDAWLEGWGSGSEAPAPRRRR